MTLLGLTALSVETKITCFVFTLIAILQMVKVVITLLKIPDIGFFSTSGTCL